MPATETLRRGIKKRKYSKLGCTECKRRKVKCDETKPMCWQCSHLGKNCVYSSLSTRITFCEANFSGVGSKAKEERKVKKQIDKEIKAVKFTSSVTKRGAKSDVDSCSPGVSMATPDMNAVLYDATVLATDLSTSMADPLLTEGLESWDELSDRYLAPVHGHKWDEIAKNLCTVSSLELYYLKIFYEKTSYWLMPLANSPDENVCNEILFHQLIRTNSFERVSSSYLQSAMVSISAKYQYNVTKLEEHNTIRKYFLGKTFQQLNWEFESLPEHSLIALNIESLILCILLLTLDTSSFKSKEWKVHLRGAKDLFLKYQKMGYGDNNNDMREKCLALSRSWFAAIETTASIIQVGALKVEDDVDEMYALGNYTKYSDILRDMGLLTENGYNIFLGYSTEAISLLKETVKSARTEAFQDPYNDKFMLISTLVQASRDYTFLPNNFGLVDNSVPIYLEFQPHGSYVRYQGGVYSIYDSVQQTHVDAVFLLFILKVLKLPQSCSVIQNSADRIWKMMAWMFKDCKLKAEEATSLMSKIETGDIKTYADFSSLGVNLVPKCIIEPMREDFRAMMFQAASIMCGTILAKYEIADLRMIRCKIISYFQCLVESLGAESGKASLEMLFRKWSGKESGVVYESGESYNEDDALPFS